MTELASRVSDFAALCHPDQLYTREDVDAASFVELDLADLLGDPGMPTQVGVALYRNGEPEYHLLNNWSRAQLLSIVGTKEKWFSTVARPQEAEELDLRRSALYNHRFRTMRSTMPGVHLLRGIVSSAYGDIPDTDIMDVLLEMMPNGYAVRHLSGKTDRALYVHAVNGDPIGIPGTSFFGLPGIVVKNSEVGHTSLWVIPILYLPHHRCPLIFEKQVLLRRTHRGTISEMKEKFEEAVSQAAAVWADADTRVASLASITYTNADVAISEMKEMITGAGGSKMLALRAAQKYAALGSTTHSGSTILTALLGAVEKTDADAGYSDAAIAGAVLWKLTNQ